MTLKQWNLFNGALSSGLALAETRIREMKHVGFDPAMYVAWQNEMKQAQTELVGIRIAHEKTDCTSGERPQELDKEASATHATSDARNQERIPMQHPALAEYNAAAETNGGAL